MKKLIVTVIIFLCVFFYVKAQPKNSLFSLSEFSFSINRSILKDNNTQDRNGFGFGVYHISREHKLLNLIYGVEYNKSRQFKEYWYSGHNEHIEDISVSIENISLPFTIRYSIGKKNKLQIDGGVFFDLYLNSKAEGKLHSYVTDNNGNLQLVISDFNDKVEFTRNNYGFQGGVSFVFPLKDYNLFIKPDFKYGLFNLNKYGENIFIRYFRINMGLQF